MYNVYSAILQIYLKTKIKTKTDFLAIFHKIIIKMLLENVCLKKNNLKLTLGYKK